MAEGVGATGQQATTEYGMGTHASPRDSRGGALGEDPLEVGPPVEAVELGDDYRLDGRRRLGAPHRVGEQEVLPSMFLRA